MAAVMFRGRSLRSRRLRGRHDDSEENLVLDYSKDPNENLVEILKTVGCRVGASKQRKLGYYNAFVRFYYRRSADFQTSLSREEILACLRMGLFHEAKELRAAVLRALRYYLQDEDTLRAMLRLHIDYMVARSLDICLDNDIERIHALRLIRKMVQISPKLLPRSVMNAMVSIAADGAAERDKMVKASLATLCELAFSNPRLVAISGGIGAILRSVLDCPQLPRINESLLTAVLYMLNHPQTRHYIRTDIDLEQMLAPFTDSHFRHNAVSHDHGHSGDERENLFAASKMAIVTIIRSWPGMMRLCKPDGSGLQSFLGTLYLPIMETRKELMDILYDVFRLPLPVWTDCFTKALLSVEPSAMRESWRLNEGFVAEEGKAILPHLAKTRPNLVENHMALLLSVFISAGLLEALIEVIATSTANVSIRATILLGELLHMANMLIPYEASSHSHCLPTLVSLATSMDITAEQRNHAQMAVSCLSRLHDLKKRGSYPCSLFLNQIIQRVINQRVQDTDEGRPARVQREKLMQCLTKDSDADVVSQALRDSQVLLSRTFNEWDWDLIVAILKWPDTSLKRLEEQTNQKFVRRMVTFYKPSSKQFSTIDLTKADTQNYSEAALTFVDFLLDCEDPDGQKFLEEFLLDIVAALAEVRSQRAPDDALFSPAHLMRTMSQDYFLLLGRLSATQKGDRWLDSTGIYQHLLDIVTITSSDTIIKLIVSSLDYVHDGMARLILSKALTATSESARLYTASFMRVLLRARVRFLANWGMEMLVMQLYDQSKAVAMEALSVLSEACEEEVNLHTLVAMRPSVLHLGYKGAMLLARLLSIPVGFKALSDANYLTHELKHWHEAFNKKYCEIVEERLNQALTTYEKTYDGSYTRRSAKNQQRQDVYVPIHLYGQLVQHKEGYELLERQSYLPSYFTCIREQELHTEDQIKTLKAALWAVGHIGTSVWGLTMLQDEDIIPEIIKLAEESGVFSVRGTAFYVLGLLGSTRRGADLLAVLGWESVRHKHGELWPVLEDEEEPAEELVSASSSFSHLGDAPTSRPFSTSLILAALTDQSHEEANNDRPYYSIGPNGITSRSDTVASEEDTKPHTDTMLSVDSNKSRSSTNESYDSLKYRTDTLSSEDGLTFTVKPRSETESSAMERSSSSPQRLDDVFENESDEQLNSQDWDDCVQSSEQLASDSEGFHTPPLDIKQRLGSSGQLLSSSENSSPTKASLESPHDALCDMKLANCDRSPVTRSPLGSPQLAKMTRPCRSASDPPHRTCSPKLAVKTVNFGPSSVPDQGESAGGRRTWSPADPLRPRSQSFREDHSNVSNDTTKSHSDSGATESTTSGISSYDSDHPTAPGQTTLTPIPSASSVTTQEPKPVIMAAVSDPKLIHPSDTKRKQSNLKRVPSMKRRFSNISLGHLSPLKSIQAKNLSESMLVYNSSSRNFSGYTALRELQRTNTMWADLDTQFSLMAFMDEPHLSKAKSMDFRLGRPRMPDPDDKEDSYRPIDPRHIGARHMSYSSLPDAALNSNAAYDSLPWTPSKDRTRKHPRAGGRAEYIGLSLPVDVSMLFQVNEGEDQRSVPQDAEEDPLEEECQPPVRVLRSVSQCQEYNGGLEYHNEYNCIGCYRIRPPEGVTIQIAMEGGGMIEIDGEGRIEGLSAANRGPSPAALLHGKSGLKSRNNSFSDMVGSITSCASQESSARTTVMNEDTEGGKVLIRKEVLRLIVSLSSSVGVKSSEQGLLILKQKFPKCFQDMCLYSEVCYLMSRYSYRLNCRRFIQELFQDFDYAHLYEEIETLLGVQRQDEPEADNGDVYLEQLQESNA